MNEYKSEEGEKEGGLYKTEQKKELGTKKEEQHASDTD